MPPTGFEDFQDGLGYWDRIILAVLNWNRIILAILNLHVAPMHPTKFGLNLT